MIVAVTGHRPPKLGGYYIPNPIYLNVREVLRTAFREQDDRATAAGDELMILSGMALGVDQWAAEICLEEGIKWTAVVPFHGWDSRWPDASRRHYQRLLNEADSVHVVTDTTEYRANLLYRRNAWMVDNASLVLAIWNGSAGGTSNCIEYARRKRVRTELLPVPLEIWDQARALERPARNNPQLLMEIFRPMTASPEDAARMREQQHANQQAMMNSMRVPSEFLNGAGDAAGSIAYAQRAIAARMQGYLGQQNNAMTRAAMENQARSALQSIADRGILSNVGEVRVEANVVLPRTAEYISMDLAVEPDQTARRGLLRDLRSENSISEEDLRNMYGEILSTELPQVAVAQEPTKQEIITPEKRFLPGRIIDIED